MQKTSTHYYQHMMYAFNFLRSLQFFGAVVVPFYTQRMNFSYAQMFCMELVFSVSLFLFEIPTGVVADRAGRRISICLGSVLFGAGFMVIGWTHSIVVFILMQIMTALGMSLISGADRALLYENSKLRGRTDEKAAIDAARYDAAGTAGMLIAFPLGSLFVSSQWASYTLLLGIVFFVSGLCTAIAGFVALFVAEPARKPEQTQDSAFMHAVNGFTFIFYDPPTRRFCLNYAVISSLTFLMFWFYQTLLAECCIPVAWNGFIAAGFNAGAVLLLSSSGFFTKRFGTQTVLFLSSIVPGILYVLVSVFQQSFAVVLIAIFGVIMLRMFRAPLLTTLINMRIDNDRRATVLSGVSMIERIMISILYPIAGFLMDWSLRYTYAVVGFVTIVVSVIMRFFLRSSSSRNGMDDTQ